MSKITKKNMFVYSWFIDNKETEITSIRIYGIDSESKNICLRVDDFTPYIYIELPTFISWNTAKAQLVSNKIDSLLGKHRPLKKVLVMKKKLYGAYLNEYNKRKKFPYLFCSFSNGNDAKKLSYILKKRINVVSLGSIKLKIHEIDADPILQLTCCRNIKTAGWINFTGKSSSEKITLCDYEYKVKWKNLNNLERNQVVIPKILGFDIEVNSSNPTAMPKSDKPEDKIFQISCVFSSGSTIPVKYLLSLGKPNCKIVGKDVIVKTFRSEEMLLIGFTKLINTENPNVIVGYNILGFDIPYMIARGKHLFCLSEFDKMGFHKYNHSEEKTIKWSSSAYKNQEFEYLDAEGRLFVDLLPLVKRDYKFNNYKLKTVAEYFCGQTKDPLDAKGIFKCYREGRKKDKDGNFTIKAQKALGIVGKYCVKDSELVILLMDKLKTWVGLSEMASVCQVPIFYLYTKGQQIKVYSQIYKYCINNNIVVEKDAYECPENERYVGAKVFDPIPGKYDMVVPFDFCSLYPTTIIAYNIDYHTWVPEDSNIPDKMCHIMEWEDHISCPHDPKIKRKIELTTYIDTQKIKIKKLRDIKNKCKIKSKKNKLILQINKEVELLKPYTQERSNITKTISKHPMCAKRKYKFLKEPKGVLPTILQDCLDARKRTRQIHMKKCKDQIKVLKKNNKDYTEYETLLDVLNKRQLAYKVSCNSMYGAMGVRKGYLPFMPGACCTTYMGRKNIEIVAKTIPHKYGGELIYGDTDSNYIHFPELKGAKDTWDHALYVASEVSKMFPSPIELEFEEEIYSFFFILSKKRYMYRKCLRDGKIDRKIGKKGVLLARRDNSNFVRVIYETVMNLIADNRSFSDIIYYISEELNELFSGHKDCSNFIITKSIGSINNLEAIPFYNEKNEKKMKVGDYTVPFLPDDKEDRLKKLSLKKAIDDRDFYLKSLPAVVQLAHKMRNRGLRVDAGSRLEYIVCFPDNLKGKQYEKIESADYVKRHKNIIKIDYLYYLKALMNPLDQMLNVAFKNQKDYIMDQYKLRLTKFKYVKEISNFSKPQLICS